MNDNPPLRGFGRLILSRFSGAPAAVRHISLLILAYAVAVLIGTLWFAVQTHFQESGELLRGVVRFGAMTVIAFWLLSLEEWAWWIAAAACVFFTSLGILAIIALGVAAVFYESQVALRLLKLVVPTYLLGHATVMLLRKETRVLFRSRPEAEVAQADGSAPGEPPAS